MGLYVGYSNSGNNAALDFIVLKVLPLVAEAQRKGKGWGEGRGWGATVRSGNGGRGGRGKGGRFKLHVYGLAEW